MINITIAYLALLTNKESRPEPLRISLSKGSFNNLFAIKNTKIAPTTRSIFANNLCVSLKFTYFFQNELLL